LTRLPLCKPIPEKLAGALRVCWFDTGALEQMPEAVGKFSGIGQINHEWTLIHTNFTSVLNSD
jgi:hypothetical protein